MATSTKVIHTYTLPNGQFFKTSFACLFMDDQNNVIGRSNYAHAKPKHAKIRIEMITDFENSNSSNSPARFKQRLCRY